MLPSNLYLTSYLSFYKLSTYLFSPIFSLCSVLQANQKKARSEVTTAQKESDRQGDTLMVMIEGVRELAKR